MCGRYRRHSDKQRIAELFAASAELEEPYFGPEDDVAPGSVQPVLRINSRGERKISLMRWGFKREDGNLLFNARAESITDVNFGLKGPTGDQYLHPHTQFDVQVLCRFDQEASPAFLRPEGEDDDERNNHQ
jgi:hypothetical protein